ncbi:MAG: hypothetical protein NVS1B11_22010 [Terriglobales bacterium]
MSQKKNGLNYCNESDQPPLIPHTALDYSACDLDCDNMSRSESVIGIDRFTDLDLMT